MRISKVRFPVLWTLLAAAALVTVATVGVVRPTAAEPGKTGGIGEGQLPDAVGPAASRAVTIYMDGSGGKKNSARRMNELHDVMAARGWRLIDIAVHFENADLEGWWISYVAASG